MKHYFTISIQDAKPHLLCGEPVSAQMVTRIKDNVTCDGCLVMLALDTEVAS